ncbi:MAG: starch-binding protein [Bacteroidales bacterium]|nr:starch-binding protein [Bacteroidales bacterium]
MKKNFTLFLMMLAAMVSFQVSADMWIIGAISPDGWTPSKGVQMTTEDNDVYTVDIDVKSLGNQYFCLTSKLDPNWSGILAYRYGGDKLVPFDTETALIQNTDKSPYCKFEEAGTYTFTFKVSTKTLKVTKKSTIELPKFNGTIFVSKTSRGNIWAWDNDGNYFDEWPGQAISALPDTTVAGTAYYKFSYTHNASSPGLIFNDGTAQTGDITPEDGKVYTYMGGSTYTVSDLGAEPPTPQTDGVYILGEVNGYGWSAYDAFMMTRNGETNTYTADVVTDGASAGYSYFSFTTKLAEPTDTANQGWDAIAPYRFGAIAEGDFLMTKELLGEELALSELGGTTAFKIPAGTYEFELNLDTRTLIITGEMEEIVESKDVYIIGEVNSNGWAANVGVKMDMTEENIYTADIACDGANEGYNYFSFTKKLAETEDDWASISAYRFGANSEDDFWITDEHYGNVIGLGAMGSTVSFRIAEGDYTITLNLAEGTMVVKQATTGPIPVHGDVNGDGIVNVSDVTSLINKILAVADFNDEACDINADGMVNVSDVTALVNMILE